MIPTDPTDPAAMAPITLVPMKSTTSYNEPGLPTPPAGWGRKLGVTDESIEEAPDTKSDDRD